MVGAVGVVLEIVPLLVAGKEIPMPLPALQGIALAQTGIYLAIAVLVGVVLARKVGLYSALAQPGGIEGRTPLSMSVAGLLGGLLGCLVLVAASFTAPSDVLAAQDSMPEYPLWVRVAYGGVTEEILLRFGVLTLIAWALIRWLHLSRSTALTVAVLSAALLFAAGHLPALGAMGVALSAETFTYVMTWNTVFGLVAGFIYCRYSLESAIGAHCLAHLFAYLVVG